MTQLDLAHVLPGRVRLRFQPPLPLPQAIGIEQHLRLHSPELSVRLWGHGQGLVIEDRHSDLAPDLLSTLAGLLQNPPLQHAQGRERMGRLLMTLAMLGWALPILPGTPFFLLSLAVRPRRP